MSTATTPNGYPYPNGDDPVNQGDDRIKGLATAVDTRAGVSAAGVATVVISTAAISGSAPVVFPAGRFTVPPVVTISSANSSGVWIMGGLSAVTKDGCNVWITKRDGTTGTNAGFGVNWIARSPG